MIVLSYRLERDMNPDTGAIIELKKEYVKIKYLINEMKIAEATLKELLVAMNRKATTKKKTTH